MDEKRHDGEATDDHEAFDRWLHRKMPLPFRPCECGCGKLVEGGLMEAAHPEDYRDERG